MKILVPVKRVIDYNVKVRVKADGSGVDLANVKMSMNPFDEIAVEAALRLREAGQADEIVVVSFTISYAALPKPISSPSTVILMFSVADSVSVPPLLYIPPQ